MNTIDARQALVDIKRNTAHINTPKCMARMWWHWLMDSYDRGEMQEVDIVQQATFTQGVGIVPSNVLMLVVGTPLGGIRLHRYPDRDAPCIFMDQDSEAMRQLIRHYKIDMIGNEHQSRVVEIEADYDILAFAMQISPEFNWVVMRVHAGHFGHEGTELMGVFTEESVARQHCKQPNDALMPVPMNTWLGDQPQIAGTYPLEGVAQ